jgi:hypothetical protein
MARVNERDLVALLLVEAIESSDPSAFTPEESSEAALAAVSAQSDAELLTRRSAFLLLRAPAPMRAWARVGLLPEHALGVTAGVAFGIGAVSNYLGPAQRVHVALNPLTALVLWHLAVYALLAWRRARGQNAAPGIAERALPRAAFAWQRLLAVLRGRRDAILRFQRIGAIYWSAYWQAAGAAISARLAALLHVAAIALTLGALAGIYVRGIFFDYRAVWASTWFDAEGIAQLLNLMLGPACLLLDGRLLDAETASRLFAPEGSDAGFWIHRLALGALLVVVLPRSALALAAALRARGAAAAIEVDLARPYCALTLRAVREGVIHRVREGIATALRIEIAKVAEGIARFVETRFFDRDVAPALVAFRNRGGRVAELESELQRAREAFEPELDAQLRASGAEFRENVAAALHAIAGAELGRDAAPHAELTPSALRVSPELGSAVAARFGDAVALGAAAAVSAAVATISGGLGKTLGVAVVTALLHTSGPIGMLIGGIAALATAGVAYALGRERVTAAAKQWRIPAPLAALALRDAKLERARADTRAQVVAAISAALEPRVAEVSESLLRQLARA